jgi:hypothetical protein
VKQNSRLGVFLGRGDIAPKLGVPKSAKIDSRVVLRAATNFCLKTNIENRKLPSGAPKSPLLIDVSCQNEFYGAIFEIGADFRKLPGLITHERTPISYVAFARNV